MTTYAELRALAEEAELCYDEWEDHISAGTVGQYLDAADPQTILALLDELAAAQAAVRDLASAVEHSRRCLIGDTSVGLRHATAIAAAREGATK